MRSNKQKVVVADLDGAQAFRFVRTPIITLDSRTRETIAHLHLPNAFSLLHLTPFQDEGQVEWVFANSAEEAYQQLIDANALIAKGLPITKAHLTYMPHLQYIMCYGIDTRDFDLLEIKSRNIIFESYARHAHSVVAEQSFTLLLALVRKLRKGEHIVRSGLNPYAVKPWRHANNWAGVTSIGTLRDKTLGIVGLGEIGIQVAQIANSFRMHVMYTQRHEIRPEMATQLNVTFRSLPELLAEADYVTLHIPLTPQTLKLINGNLLHQMKQTAYLINTARSRIIDNDALYECLVQGRIAGAGFDVYDLEPISTGHRLAALDNVILSPHFGSEPIDATLHDVKTVMMHCLQQLRALRL